MIRLFIEFFKAGLFSIGGGLATLPFLKDIADNYAWFTSEELVNMIAISESTPGPIGINMSTYAGVEAYGVLGGIVSTFALVLPSVIIIILVSKILDKFRENKIIENAFYGLRPATAGLIAGAVYDIFIMTIFTDVHTFNINVKSLIFFIITFIAIKKLPKLHPVVFICLGAVVGIVFNF